MALRDGLRLFLRDPMSHEELLMVTDGDTVYAIGKPGAQFEICVDVNESAKALLPACCVFWLDIDNWPHPCQMVFKPRKHSMVLFRGIPYDSLGRKEAAFTFTDAAVAAPGYSSSSAHQGVIKVRAFAAEKREELTDIEQKSVAPPSAATSSRDDSKKFIERATLGIVAAPGEHTGVGVTKHLYRPLTRLPIATLTLHYERREVLEARGIVQPQCRVAARVDLCTVEPAQPVERAKRTFVDLTDGDDDKESVKRMPK